MNYKRVLSTLIGVAVFSTVAMSQTRSELSWDYGSPKAGIYWIAPALVMDVEFDDEGQALNLNISPREFIERKAALKITEKLTAGRREGVLLRHITFSGGCTSIEGYSYKNVAVSYTRLCQPKGEPRITGIYIRWRDNIRWE